ncbi:hypothetical protein FA15DRAFT_116119 [Coprinopsis marcescibilis]|uniref:Peptidase C14 caspase domain-containing protein n=1 Tax=Coprinopsis marcescibilis TaxID=230819 RepID=A0A5C3KJX3_COPMA|nr:hypothetical protein FA15DRAFT_116119 [Coprinopsis marcescibilis]
MLNMNTTTIHNPTSNAFALVIGINKYHEASGWDSLSAATKDADAMYKFLRTNLNIPADHIVNLRDEEANRKGILNGFKCLHQLTAGSIDPVIVIFYAGHGARTPKPAGWGGSTGIGEIEMICPSDLGTPDPSSETGVVEGIPDRTVGAWLNKLSTDRGNNITLILDCCCSAGLSRSGAPEVDPKYKPRSIENPPPISSKCDEDLFSSLDGTRGLSTTPGFHGQFQDSHVLLAACASDKQAYEYEGRGIFTQRLLSALEKFGILTTTYDSLLTRMKMPIWQTPHMEGTNMNRLIFNVRGRRSDPFLIPGYRKKLDGAKEFSYILEAGAAQGIEPNALFSIHDQNLLDIGTLGQRNPPLGTLSVLSVEPFKSYLQILPSEQKFKIPLVFYARWSDRTRKPILVFSEDQTWLNDAFSEEKKQELGVIVAAKAEDASLIFTIEGDKVCFDRNDTLAKPFLGSRFAYKVDVDDLETVYDIIRAWRHFNHHLSRTSPTDFPKVRMELYYLERDEYDVYSPIGENLIEREPAHLKVEEGNYVGMTIYNESGDSLYPHLFYFDPNDLSIVKWKINAEGMGEGRYDRDSVDSPLPAHSVITVGHGEGEVGGGPWEFIFDEGVDTDVGFFKLFLTASPANFESLAQDNPFDGASRSADEGDMSFERIDPNAWGSKLATVIQLSPNIK